MSGVSVSDVSIIGTRKIVKKGGSAAVTLPPEVGEILQLEGEIAFVKVGERIFLENPKAIGRFYEELSDLVPRSRGSPDLAKLEKVLERVRKELQKQ